MTRILHSLWLLLATVTTAQAAEPIRIAALAFGTLTWELATIREAGLDKAQGIDLQDQTLASPQAGTVALQAGNADIIVTDWFWVSRQRETGADFTFVPYSANHGVLVVPPGSGIRSVADLAGKRLGVAGGGMDKNWLLLRALAKKKHGLDLEQAATVNFGAPPLLNAQLQQGKLDALLDYWHYAAELEAKGFRPLLTGQDLLRELGVDRAVPSLGYVFRESWAGQHPAALRGFLAAAREAKRLLCESDSAWERVRSLTREDDPAVRAALRRDYCTGRVRQWGPEERQAADVVYQLVRQAGGPEATGASATPAPGTFWADTAVH